VLALALPQRHEDARLVARGIEVIALGLVAAQLHVVAGVEPLRRIRPGDDLARLAAHVRHDAQELPALAAPAPGHGAALEDHGDFLCGRRTHAMTILLVPWRRSSRSPSSAACPSRSPSPS